MKIYLIRHGETPGNREHRYVGSTDEGLTPEARRLLSARQAPEVDRIYASPLRRCRETADILFPGRPVILVPGFSECQFGRFEYKNYKELSGDPDYQRWIDSGGTIGFPGGESRLAFQDRCERAFLKALTEAKQASCRSVAMVIHGGTIMALLSRLGVPETSYFDWQVGNGEQVEVWERAGKLYWQSEV